MKQLQYVGIYKDGGSTSWKDSSGQKYWLNNKFGDKHKNNRGKLFLGNIDDKDPKLAEGHYCLTMRKNGTHYIFQ